MSLQDVYRRFLADPKSAALAPDVSLLYVTTTTRFDQADAVRTHLSQQQKVVEKKSDEVISAIEAPGSLCLDVETTLEFLTGGGAYLPSMDDNFLADRVATFPTVHIVRFNAHNQIQQVKLYWDQGSLLKQIEVIGSRGRNWPIRDAKEQTRFIKSGILSAPTDNAPAPAPAPAPFLPANADKPADENERPSSPGKRRIKDPYAADSLVDLLSPGKDRVESARTPRAPATGQPPPRDIGDLFVSHDDDTPEQSPTRKPVAPQAGAGRNHQPSRLFNDSDEPAEAAQPAKTVAPKAGASHKFRQSRIFDDDETVAAEEPAKTVAPKAGAGHKFRPSRIFDDDETVAAEEGKKPSTYRNNPNRFSHFEVGGDNSEREAKPIPTRPKSQHMAQWKFEDFVTPEKPVRKPRGQEIRHFGWSDDEVDGTPPAKPHVPQPRRDAQSHIQLTDEMDDQNDNNSTAARANRSKASSVSQNPLYQDGDDGDAPNEHDNNNNKAPPLSVVANGANRKKDFDSHWSMSDASPADEGANAENKKPVGTDRLKAVQMMAPSWENYDESPQRPKAPAPRRAARSAIDRHWGFEDM